MAQDKRYRVIVAPSALNRYQQTVLPYLLRNFSEKRVAEIAALLNQQVRSLELVPYRGAVQYGFQRLKSEVRYILLRETRHFELKIVYVVKEAEATVWVTDFFPTVMHPKRLRGGGKEK